MEIGAANLRRTGSLGLAWRNSLFSSRIPTLIHPLVRLFLPQILFTISALIVMWQRSWKSRDIGLSREKFGKNISTGFLVSLGPAAITMFIAGALTLIHSIRPFLPYPVWGGTSLATNWSPWFLSKILIVAPITEEIFFRGVLLKGLREHFSSKVSVVVSSLIFMLCHGGFHLGPLCLGLITAPLAIVTHSILPGIIFHTMSNAYGPLAMTLFPNLYRYISVFYQ